MGHSSETRGRLTSTSVRAGLCASFHKRSGILQEVCWQALADPDAKPRRNHRTAADMTTARPKTQPTTQPGFTAGRVSSVVRRALMATILVGLTTVVVAAV